uniref:Glycosyltransferase N-terminal domain-containing protein n=2 Tax=Quercus lobata TaxID=97700 RepID=A0A7N2MQK5_QUELO
MKLSHQIANQGIKVTFVSTEFIIARLTTTMPVNSLIRLVSLPDGLEPGDDRTDALKLINIFQEVMPGHFKDLIEKSNESYDDQISCVIAGISVVNLGPYTPDPKAYRGWNYRHSRFWNFEFVMGSQPHVLVIPFPAQGHVAPLMKLSHQIVDHGIKVTFVTTEFINARLTTKMPANSPIRLVSLPDGLEPEDDQIDTLKLINSFQETKPDHFKDLIEKINESTDDRIICVIADVTVAWAFDVAEKMGIQSVAFWPAGPANLALIFHIPKLIEDGIIDTQGTLIKNDLIWLSKEIPAWKSSEFPWSFPGESWMQNIFFQYVFKMNHCVKLCKWLLCNSFYELDLLALNLIPGIIPVGPLLSGNQLENHIGSFWPEDSTCLSWLDKQPVGSVIYASFGSTSTFNQQQFDELALGLELTGLPFLSVIRSDIANEALSEFLDGIRSRIADSGKIVGWAPQE